MGLSKEQLREFLLLYRRFTDGEIGREEYNRLSAELFPTEGGAPPDPSILGSLELETITSCHPTQKRARQRNLKRQMVSRERSFTSYYLDQLQQVYIQTPKRQDTFDRPTPPNQSPAEKLLERNRRAQAGINAIKTLSGMAVALCLTLIICTSGPVERLVRSLQPQESTAIALSATPQKHTKVRPLFGPLAVEQCTTTCETRDASTQPACYRSCGRLALPDYAKRAGAFQPNAERDSDEILRRCSALEVTGAKSRTAWQDDARGTVRVLSRAPGLNTLSDFGNTRLLYNNLLDAATTASIPATASDQERGFSKQLLRASCLRANLSLVELGLLVAQQSSDVESQRFFSSLRKVLAPQTIDAENSIVNWAATILERPM